MYDRNELRLGPVTHDEVNSLKEWLRSWGAPGEPNWADPTGQAVPIAKITLRRLLEAAARGVDGFAQDAISHSEAHGVRE
jgi:hypothetical protein